jgi:hypothetical protein
MNRATLFTLLLILKMSGKFSQSALFFFLID